MTQRLQQHLTQLDAIVAASQDAIISLGTDFLVRTWSAGAQRMFGFEEAEARGHTLKELIVPDIYSDESDAVLAAVLNGETVLKEMLRRHKDDHLVPVEINASPILSPSGRVVGSSIIYRNISDRRRAEEAQARLAAIVNSSVDAITGETLDGVITIWNEAAERMFGYSADEMVGQSFQRLIPAPQRAKEDEITTRLAQGESFDPRETKLLTRDGQTFDASITFSPIRDSEGRLIGSSKIIHDITERKRMEARIVEHQAQLAAFVEQTPAAIGMFDTKMTYLAVSRRYLSDHRAKNANLIGVSHYEAFPEMPQRWRDIHTRVLAGEELSADEDSWRRADGRIDWYRWSMKPWRTPDGRIGGALLFTEVINKEVEARRALAASEERFRVTFESAPVGIAHVGPDSRWLRVNEALCRILGYPAREFTAKTILDVTHPDDVSSSADRFEQVLSGKIDRYAADKRYLHKDGATVWVRLTVNCVRKRDGSMDYLVTVVEDISARKRAEEELADSEKRFRATFENVAVGVSHVAPDGRFLRFNQALCRLLGWPAGELVTKSVQQITHPDDFAFELAEWDRLRAGEIDSYSLEKRDLRKDGTIVWIRLTRSCVRKNDGSIDYFVAVVEDISARKRAEEQVHLLMREANHRVKNLLGLVQVIARQTAAANPEDFALRFTERVQALAANQDLLGRCQQHGADLEDLVRSQLAHFADLVGSRITAHGQKLRLNAIATQAIGLALHELATNAGKYGALSTDAGHVDVDWRIDGDAFMMSWTERNGPPVRRPERQGFGTTVISSMAKHAMDGEVQLDFAPAGLVWRLTCPASSALKLSEESDDGGDAGR